MINPITRTDYPDPDVIRVGDTYYMISTTMYFMPGGVILKSFDLVNWEIESYVFDTLDNSDAENLKGNSSSYGKGMWAATLRYHNGKFYVAFVSHGRENTHLFISDSINGPWEHKFINEYFHDCSLLFDDDGKVYIVSGNMNIRLTELMPDLSGIKPDGIDKIIVSDNPEAVRLGYEGSHIYKINGKYVLTLIHWPHYNGRRTEAVFISDRIEGPYVGKDVTSDDMGLADMGVAQGGIVDTPDGNYYAVLFQDSGAVGRVPVLIPVTWKDGETFPEFGNNGLIPKDFPVPAGDKTYKYEPLFVSDDFNYEDGNPTLKKQWQWNHAPDKNFWKIEDSSFRITTRDVVVNPVWAINTLTQRMNIDGATGITRVDASNLNNGDFAGLIALQGCYGFIGILKENDKYYVVNLVRSKIPNPFEIGYTDREPGEIVFKEEISSPVLDLGIEADFKDMTDTISFMYKAKDSEEWIRLDRKHKLSFGLDHFTGARFGLTTFSTEVSGGTGVFEKFIYA